MKVTPIKRNFGTHKVGDPFDLPEPAARLLIKIGMLAAVDELSPRPKRQYQRRDMRAES